MAGISGEAGQGPERQAVCQQQQAPATQTVVPVWERVQGTVFNSCLRDLKPQFLLYKMRLTAYRIGLLGEQNEVITEKLKCRPVPWQAGNKG